jgi:hypothetical protein
MRLDMTPPDLRVFCAALGFTAVVMQGGNPPKKEAGHRAKAFADLIEEFCRMSVPDAFGVANVNLSDDSDVTEIDRAIDKHIEELRTKESTILPEDKAILLKYYDRLQQRKSRRMQSAFYEMADARVLADRVLKHLDEEIEDGGA